MERSRSLGTYVADQAVTDAKSDLMLIMCKIPNNFDTSLIATKHKVSIYCMSKYKTIFFCLVIESKLVLFLNNGTITVN